MPVKNNDLKALFRTGGYGCDVVWGDNPNRCGKSALNQFAFDGVVYYVCSDHFERVLLAVTEFDEYKRAMETKRCPS